ncbi:MAG: hypothetical protein LV479_03195 [Methylacidiphilales bacterium]|nr:hypothetical protein [Candidatus Methylacidiphilales bacterium]
MRLILAVLLLVLALRGATAAPATPEAFIAAIKSAIAAKRADQILALTYTMGMSDADKEMTPSIDKFLLFANPVTNISFFPLPPYYLPAVYVSHGKKSELTTKPRGMVFIGFDPDSGNGARNTLLPYAVIDGRYYLVGSKTTDLDWKGPPDKTLSFMVMGQGTNSVRVHIKWDASGVELERIIPSGSSGFMGQYFESVKVVCSASSADLTLELMENGKDIAPVLKGKGSITYSK